ncbi:MAG: pyridoxal phosphate-dependent aminotransferase [Silicimonas sp.]
MSRPQETPLAASLPSTVPFVGPEALERSRGRGFVARIGANESVFGPSPKVIQAIREAAPDAWKYGDPENLDLRHALAEYHGVAADEVVVGEGVDALLGYVVRLYAGPGDRVVTSDGAYPTFNYHVAGYGAALTKVPYRDDREDPEALLKAVSETSAKLVYLSNPDNPMGTWHTAGVIDDMIADLPKGCLLVLDEAYVEFAPEEAIPRIDTSNPQVIRMRTFSKAHGLAGMRVGYAIGEREVIRGFEKVRNHFGMSRLGQVAALAALADGEWLKSVKAEVSRSRERIGVIARDNGLVPLPSATNFVTIDCGRDGSFAKAVLQALIEQDVFVRMPFAAPGNRCIRISCGTTAELDLLTEVLPHALACALGK